jgi:hypothetical protein
VTTVGPSHLTTPKRVGELADLDQAIQVGRQAVQSTPVTFFVALMQADARMSGHAGHQGRYDSAPPVDSMIRGVLSPILVAPVDR